MLPHAGSPSANKRALSLQQWPLAGRQARPGKLGELRPASLASSGRQARQAQASKLGLASSASGRPALDTRARRPSESAAPSQQRNRINSRRHTASRRRHTCATRALGRPNGRASGALERTTRRPASSQREELLAGLLAPEGRPVFWASGRWAKTWRVGAKSECERECE